MTEGGEYDSNASLLFICFSKISLLELEGCEMTRGVKKAIKNCGLRYEAEYLVLVLFTPPRILNQIQPIFRFWSRRIECVLFLNAYLSDF